MKADNIIIISKRVDNIKYLGPNQITVSTHTSYDFVAS